MGVQEKVNLGEELRNCSKTLFPGGNRTKFKLVRNPKSNRISSVKWGVRLAQLQTRLNQPMRVP